MGVSGGVGQEEEEPLAWLRAKVHPGHLIGLRVAQVGEPEPGPSGLPVPSVLPFGPSFLSCCEWLSDPQWVWAA